MLVQENIYPVVIESIHTLTNNTKTMTSTITNNTKTTMTSTVDITIDNLTWAEEVHEVYEVVEPQSFITNDSHNMKCLH